MIMYADRIKQPVKLVIPIMHYIDEDYYYLHYFYSSSFHYRCPWCCYYHDHYVICTVCFIISRVMFQSPFR